MSTLYDFSTPPASDPTGALFMDMSGNLFGVASGGLNEDGAVFELVKTASGYSNQPVTVANFSSFGAFNVPQGSLISDAAGDLLGTTENGVFEIVKTASGYSSTAVMLANFATGALWSPTGSLVADAQGDLFGTTMGGAAIFEIAKTATGYAAPTILASLDWNPSSLLIDQAGNLIGVGGGEFFTDAGAVFELAKTATGYATAPTTLASLPKGYGVTSPVTPVADAAGDLFGVTPTGGIFELTKTASGYSSTAEIIATVFSVYFSATSQLSVDSSGDIFGISSSAGPNAAVMFEIVKTASGYDSTPIYLQSFGSATGQPSGGLLTDAHGDLFGTTDGGSTAPGGQIYQLTPMSSGYAASLSALASLGVSSGAGGVTGSTPMAGVVLDREGNLFGSTSAGGATGGGGIYEIALSAAGSSASPVSLASTGSLGKIVVDASDDVFGISTGFDSIYAGSVFEIAKTATGSVGTPTVLAAFSQNAAIGYDPQGELSIDSAGDLFGATNFGGSGGGGTVFEIAKTASGYGTPTPLASFVGEGAASNGYLLLDSASDLFGIAEGGVNGQEFIFELAKSASGYASSVKTVMTFSGFVPILAPLAMDAAGDIFGEGGTLSFSNAGGTTTSVIYELVKTSAGYATSPTILSNFAGTGGLIVDAAGDLFGTSSDGGADGLGCVFELVKTATGYPGAPTILMSFNGTNGSDPNGGLVADAHGDLYGTTSQGGANGGGLVFEVTDSGYHLPVLSVSAALSASQSAQPAAIVDSAANVLANLAALDGLVSSGSVGTIAFTDPTPPALTLSGSQLAADAAVLTAITSPYGLTVTGTASVSELAVVPVSDLAAAVSVRDSAADVGGSLDSLESYAAAGKLASVTLTGTGVPVLSIGAGQLGSDAAAIEAISGGFSLSETAPSVSATITGAANALGNTMVFSGAASQYTLTPAADGIHVTVSGEGVIDTLSHVQALQFSDVSLIVAQAPTSGGAVTTGNVAELYAAALGREPDVAGLAYYQQQLAADPSLSLFTLAQYFLSSPEYTAAHNYAQSAAGDAQFITDSYENLLHRAPEAAAIPYYQAVINQFTQGLQTGTAAYAQAELQGHAAVLTYFSQSPEFLGDVQVTATNVPSSQHWLLLT